MDRNTGNRRLRLAWVVPGRLDQLTGGYLYDAQMVRELTTRGHEAQVIELNHGCEPIDPLAAVRLVLALAGRGWDAIVVDELAHPSLALGLPILRLLGQRAPVVALVHHLRSSESAPRRIRSVAGVVERLALRTVSQVICTSHTTAGTVQNLIGACIPVEVVAPGRDLHAVTAEPPMWPSATGLASSFPVVTLRVLMVAHWTPRKDILGALGALALTGRRVELDLAGDPDRDPAYAERVKAELRRPELAGRVRVHGLVSSEYLGELYRAADALLLTSTYEGYGMVLGEALAAGLPIVATRVGAVPEVVRDGREAELVEAGDLPAQARALERLLDPGERQRRADWALQRAACLPTWQQSRALFADLVEQIAAQARREQPDGWLADEDDGRVRL